MRASTRRPIAYSRRAEPRGAGSSAGGPDEFENWRAGRGSWSAAIASLAAMRATSLGPDVYCRRPSERRVCDQARIEPLAAAHRDQADALARMGQILVAEEVAQPAIGREDRVADHREQFRAQPDALGFRDRFGESPRRAVIGRGFGSVAQLGVELLDDVADGELGLDHAGGEALAEAADGAVDADDELAVARDVVVIILDIAERRRPAARGEDRIESVEAAEVVDRADRRQRQQSGGRRPSTSR